MNTKLWRHAMETQKGHYGLFTATAMIIGIVIGSGIFFKGDDVLLYTGGNILLGVLIFCIGAINIIFGSLTLTQLSIRTKKNGGVIGFFEDFVSGRFASGFGWFQTFVYYPTLIAVVGWVAAVYTCALFEVNASLEFEIGIAFFYIVLIYAMNMFSLKLGGYFQILSTIMKLIPLLGIAVAGMFLKTLQPALPEGVTVMQTTNVGVSWIAALIPIAYSFDGWIVATTITNEVKNPKKTMSLALIIGPITVLLVYILYFVGFSKMLGAEYIMGMGNEAVNKAGEFIFGFYGAKIILVFIIIAVLGVVNGLILGNIRIPQALASKNMLPNSKKIEQVHPRLQLSVSSCKISFVTACIWLLIHYVTQKSGLLGSGDVSEIAIVYSYICYGLLYVKVFQLAIKKEIKSKFKGYVCPVLALLGSLSILIGGFASNPVYVPVFIVICFIISFIGFFYYSNQTKR